MWASIAVVPAYAVTVLKLAHAGADDSTQQQAVLLFAELVKKRTNGEIIIVSYPNSKLGNDATTIAAAQSGAISIVMAGSPNYIPLAPRLTELDLPYTFKNEKSAYHELDSKIYGDALLAQTNAKGLRGLSFWEVGFRMISSNRGLIKTPEDFRGLRLRVVANPVQQAFFKSLGAEVVTMPLGEISAAIKAGKLDAQDHPLPITYSSKLYEVQKYMTLTRHAYTALLVTMNEAQFQALTVSQRKAILDSVNDARDFQRAENAKNEAKMIADLRSRGVEVFELTDSRAFQRLTIGQNSVYFAKRLEDSFK